MPRTHFRLVEHYVSVQGEGPRTGELTQFIRFAGCNMRCPLWPCDTQHAIEPSIYMAEGGSYKRTPMELVGDIQFMMEGTGAENICLTGGEPFQQPNNLLEELCEVIDLHCHIECFSNGSFLYPEWALSWIDFIMDWKLQGSGEGSTRKLERTMNAKVLSSQDCIKFVVTSLEDLDEAREVYNELLTLDCSAKFWVGAAWLQITDEEIIDYIKEHRLNWKLNVQVHKYVWPPDMKGV